MSARINNGIGVIYFIEIKPYGLIKIGFTSRSPERRMVKSSAASLLGEKSARYAPYSIMGKGFIKGTRVTERCIHSQFSKSRYTGEWFLPDDDLVNFIEENSEKFDKRVCFNHEGNRISQSIKIDRNWRNLLLGKFDAACRELNLTKEEFGKIVCSAKLRKKIETSYGITVEQSMWISHQIESSLKKARRGKQ